MDYSRQASVVNIFKVSAHELNLWCLIFSVRENVKVARKDFDKTEDDLKALQSVGQIIGEVLRQLDSERCECLFASSRVLETY